MFDFLLGWRKASKCKKLIKRVQCRLKLLKNKRRVIARQFREDIAQLWKNRYQHIAFNRLDELCMDEDMILVYELLEQFSEFIIINLSYICRHKDLTNDLNEAVSTLIFASARCSDLPELKLVRKLFRKRYGQKLIANAVDLNPGNLVNSQVKDKLTLKTVSEKEKNRLLDEIVGDFFIKPELLAHEYKPDSQVLPLKVPELDEVKGQDHTSIEHNSSASYSIALQSSSSTSIFGTPNQEKIEKIKELSTPTCEYDDSDAIEVLKQEKSEKVECSSESSTDQHISDQGSVIYLDDVQEFKSPTKQGDDKDQRFFMFKSSIFHDKDHEKMAIKRMRRTERSEREVIDYTQCESDYSYKSDSSRKYQKTVEIEDNERFYFVDNYQDKCRLDQPFYFYTNNEDYQVQDEVEEEIFRKMRSSPVYMTSPSLRKSRALAPYARPETVPEKWFSGANSMTAEKVPNEFNGSNKKMVYPPHVHPKLPDYDELAAKFTALKKIHQQSKFIRSLNMTSHFL